MKTATAIWLYDTLVVPSAYCLEGDLHGKSQAKSLSKSRLLSMATE